MKSSTVTKNHGKKSTVKGHRKNGNKKKGKGKCEQEKSTRKKGTVKEHRKRGTEKRARE